MKITIHLKGVRIVDSNGTLFWATDESVVLKEDDILEIKLPFGTNIQVSNE